MREALLGLMMAAAASLALESGSLGEVTEISGVVRNAATKQPVAEATVFANPPMQTARTDRDGRFVLRTSREASLLGVEKTGFLTFQYPLLRLTTETLVAEIELRTDPPGRESFATWSNLFFLCLIIDAPDRLAVRNSCGAVPLHPAEYTRRIVKHNPWNPYFGPAGDGGGILIATRIAAAAQ